MIVVKPFEGERINVAERRNCDRSTKLSMQVRRRTRGRSTWSSFSGPPTNRIASGFISGAKVGTNRSFTPVPVTNTSR